MSPSLLAVISAWWRGPDGAPDPIADRDLVALVNEAGSEDERRRLGREAERRSKAAHRIRRDRRPSDPTARPSRRTR